MNYRAKNNLTVSDQLGGWNGHSTTICVAELLQVAKEAKEARNNVALTALDLSAAYNLYDHRILYQKNRLLARGKDTMIWI